MCFSPHDRPRSWAVSLKRSPMVALDTHFETSEASWQSTFIELLPEIEQRLRRAFRHLDLESRDDLTEEGVVHALLSFVRLHEKKRATSVSASTLAWYAAKQVRRGRPAASRMNACEPLSRYAHGKTALTHDAISWLILPARVGQPRRRGRKLCTIWTSNRDEDSTPSSQHEV